MVESCLLLCRSFPKDQNLVLQAKEKALTKGSQLLSILGLEELSRSRTTIIRTTTTLTTLTSIDNLRALKRQQTNVIMEVEEVPDYPKSMGTPRRVHQMLQIHSIVFTIVQTNKAHGNHRAQEITMKVTRAGQIFAAGVRSLRNLNNREDHHNHGEIYRCPLLQKVRCQIITSLGFRPCQVMSQVEVLDGAVVAYQNQRKMELMAVEKVNSC